MTADLYERAARIYCREMGLDPDARNFDSHGVYVKCSRAQYVATRLREHDLMNKALKEAESHNE